MQTFNEKYISESLRCIQSFKAFEGTDELKYEDAITKVAIMIQALEKSKKHLYFAGNGGSAGITSHLALDFWKNANVKAQAFNDSSLLSAVGNDIGFEYVFSKPIEMFAETNDMIIAISSSGNSQNIINAAIAGKQKGCYVVTLSGFSDDNKLKILGDMNFHVSSFSYRLVEVFHTLIIHQLLDYKMHELDGVDIFNKNTKK